MNALKLLKIHFSQSEELIGILDLPESRVFHDGLASADSQLKLFRIRLKTTAAAGAETRGLQSLIPALEKLDESAVVWEICFGNKEWFGSFFLDHNLSCAVGYAIVRLEKHSPLKTPPRWDGSLEQLKRFNRKE